METIDLPDDDEDIETEIEKIEEAGQEDKLIGVKFLAKLVRRRLRNKSDIVIAVTGSEGSGKTTLAIHLSKATDYEFDLIKSVAYIPDPKQINEQYNKTKQYSVLLIDEAIKGLHKHRWFDKEQQEVVSSYGTERFKCRATILCIPRFRDLTENFRNHRVNIWIHVLRRGLAVVTLKDEDKNIDDPWHNKLNLQIKNEAAYKKSILLSPEERLTLEKKTKGYFCNFTYPQLDLETEEEYERLKIKSREELEKKETKKDEPEFTGPLTAKYYKAILGMVAYLKSKKLKNRDIAKLTGATESVVSLWVHRLKLQGQLDPYSILPNSENSEVSHKKDYLHILPNVEQKETLEPDNQEENKDA